MSSASHTVQYKTAPGSHAKLYGPLGCAGAAVIPPNVPLVVCSGNIGVDESLKAPASVSDEIELAFKNTEIALKHAGVSKGWAGVYQLTTYYPRDPEPGFDDVFMEIKNKHLGANTPVWTGVTVHSLYEGLRLEMTVNAVIS